MDQQDGRLEIARRPVVLRLPGDETVTVKRDLDFPGSEGPEALDIYYPSDVPGKTRTPIAVIVTAAPDPGFKQRVGCRFKEMEWSIGWAKLFAASGLAAVTYTNRKPRQDLDALLLFLRQNAEALGVDGSRIGVFAASAHVSLALALLMRGKPGDYLKCAALCYGYTIDVGDGSGVAEAARIFGFGNECAGRSINETRTDVPMLVVRAGSDEMPRLNETLDAFVRAAVERDLPITLANYPQAPHAFDLVRDTDSSRTVMRQILTFTQLHLRGC